MTPFRRLPFAELPELARREHPFLRMKAETVRVETAAFGKLGLHVRRWGSGPPLLLVHGLMTSSYSWRFVLDALGERFELIVPDLPGSGRSDAPAVRYGPDETGDVLAALVDALGIRGCRAIGNSMGGYLCVRLALRDGSVFGRLVDVHSPGVADLRVRALHAVLSVPGSHALLDALVRRDPERWVWRNVHYFDESLKCREETREYAAPLSTPAGRAAFGRILADTLAPAEMDRFVADLRARRDQSEAFPIPLMLLYADRDPMVPPTVGHVLQDAIPGAEMVWMRDASHFAHVDAPERFVDAVLPFLEPPG